MFQYNRIELAQCECFSFVKQALEYCQILFNIIRIILFRINKSTGESFCYTFVDNTFHLYVKITSHLISSPMIALGLYLTGIFNVKDTQFLKSYRYLYLYYILYYYCIA